MHINVDKKALDYHLLLDEGTGISFFITKACTKVVALCVSISDGTNINDFLPPIPLAVCGRDPSGCPDLKSSPCPCASPSPGPDVKPSPGPTSRSNPRPDTKPTSGSGGVISSPNPCASLENENSFIIAVPSLNI